MREDDRQFITLTHLTRTIGIALGALPVAAVLYLDHAGRWLWALLLINAIGWPHVAWWLSRRSAHPLRVEKRNQMFDAVVAGAWIAAMHYNLLPSALILSLTMMNHVGSGGWRWPLRSLPLLAISSGLLGAMLDIHWNVQTDTRVVIASLPLLVIYPSWFSYLSFKLGRRIRQQNRLLAELSRTDGLTGLANRNAWLDAAGHELDRYHRHQRAATLMLLDLDHFKAINDQFGHTTGDAALQALARILTASLRHGDTAGRFGGDEFGIVLPETNTEAASEVAERIRLAVASMRPGRLNCACSVSIGIAEAGPRCATRKAWIEQADAALYRAKAAGRNQVGFATATSP